MIFNGRLCGLILSLFNILPKIRFLSRFSFDGFDKLTAGRLRTSIGIEMTGIIKFLRKTFE